MDAKSLAKIIQLVVKETIKEEVNKIVKREVHALKKSIMTELKRSGIKQVVHEAQQKQKSTDINDIIGDVLANERANTKPKTTNTKQFTNDPLINSILNETAQTADFSKHKAYDEDDYPTMNGQMFTSQQAHAGLPPVHEGPISAQEMIPKKDTRGMPTSVDSNALPDHLMKALTRDYSALVTADSFKGKK